jgi:two-component system cell cycle response regulator
MIDNAGRTKSLRVLWESQKPFKDVILTYWGISYEITESTENPHIRVFDAGKWGSFDEAHNNFRVISLPTLILCPPDQELLWLTDQSLDHDVCTSLSSVELFAARLVRLSCRNREQSKLLKQSLVDPLTGVLNRLEFNNRMELELNTLTRDQPLSLLLTDLDHFKLVNDEHGHVVGDRILRQLANFLKASVGEASAVYRIGGEEFAILVHMNSTQAFALGEFIRNETEGYRFDDIAITISIGIAINYGGKSSSEFIHEAETALYQAKAQGRNQAVEFELFSEDARQDGTDPDILDFENHIRVLTERLTQTLTYKSQQLFSNVRKEADRDGLTGLFNRRYFDNRMKREFESARGKGKFLSLIFIDIDHFGKVNKTHGFTIGDHSLKQVTNDISSSIRPTDWVARYGGEEICVILPDTNETAACEISNRIREKVEDHDLKNYDGKIFKLTVSAGVAELKKPDKSLDDFIQRTSNRTRYAKENGRNQVCCHKTDLEGSDV